MSAVALPLAASDISYCCSTLETSDLTATIENWIARRTAEGWSVRFVVKADGDRLGVMWQCVQHTDGIYREFSPCISMAGREFRMN